MATYIFRDNSIIGNLDAETDTFLDDCFIETPAYKTLMVFSSDQSEFFKRIIVGRTGSGKTALLKKIMSDGRITKQDVIEAEKTIFEHIKNDRFISDLLAQGIDLKIFFKALWVHVILVKIIDVIHGDTGFIESFVEKLKGRKNIDKIKSYLDRYSHKFFDDEILTEITKEFQAGVESSLKTSIAEIKTVLDAGEKQRLQSETNNYVNKELLQSQKSIINFLVENSISDQQKKIVISIDDLDKSWFQNDNVHYDFINALLEAFKELLSINTVKVLISIRTDILEGVYQNKLKQDEKDLSLILPVEWTREEVRNLLDKRITHLIKDQYAQKRNPILSDIFSFNIDGIPADEFLLERIMLRPRDGIDFVNLCFKNAQGQTEIKKEHLIEAEEYFYTSRKNALVKEWSGLHSALKCYLDCLSQLSSNVFTFQNLLENHYKEIESFIIGNVQNEQSEVVNLLLDNKHEAALKKLLLIWFRVGVVGIKKNEDITIYSSFGKRELDITDYEKEFKVYPLFWRSKKINPYQ